MYNQKQPTLKRKRFASLFLLTTLILMQGGNALAQFATPSPLPKPAQMTTDPYNDLGQVGYCLDQAGSNSCTANDFTITSIETLNIDDGCTSPTDYMQIDLEVTFAKRTPTRYDVGAWFYRGVDATSGADFNDEDAIDGSFCTRVGVEGGLLTQDGDLTANLANDNGSCIDVPSGTPGNLTPQVLENLILPCRDITDANFGLVPDGIVDISACTSWSNNSGANCAGPVYQEFDLAWPNSPFSTEIQPNTGSKCNCAEFDGGPNLVNIPEISVTKSCTPTILEPGETTVCTITITNTGLGALVGASAINTAGFFYEDDYPEHQGSIGTITPSAGVSAVDGFTKDTAADNTANQSLNIYPGTIAANGGVVIVVYDFITSPLLPSSETLITNTVCANYYNDNATVGNLPDDAVFQYTSTEPGQCAVATVTTPVGLSSFNAKQSGLGGYDITWSTSTETGNLGFNIYAIVGQTRYQLNKQLIPSKTIDSMNTQNYSYHVDSQLNGFISKFVIEDVDRLGRRNDNGVYQLNKIYGSTEELSAQKLTDWDRINFKHNQLTQLKQKKLSDKFNSIQAINHSQESNSAEVNEITVDLSITESGIYQVSYADLKTLGINLSGLERNNISLSYNGQLISLDMRKLNKRGKFQDNSYFQFYANSVNTLYSDTNIYELRLYTDNASPKMNTAVARPHGNNFAESYQRTVSIDRNLVYSYGSPIESEPWYDTRMFAIQSPLNLSFNLPAEHLFNLGGNAALSFEYWGGLDFANDDQDHKLNFMINGNHLGTDEFDGLSARSMDFSIQTGLLNSDNEINIELPAETVNKLDIIHLESISLTYPAEFVAENNQLNFVMPQDNYKVTGLSDRSIQVYAVLEDEVTRFRKFKIKSSNNGFQAEFSGLNGDAQYFVLTKNSAMVPELQLSQSVPVPNVSTEHLIISHSDFIGSDLTNYASVTRQNFQIVDVENIYNKYSNKVANGESIKQFIEDVAAISDLKSVLLVGGDSYDYKDYLGLGAISFVPTIYRETDDLIKYSAVDALFGDTNNNGVPDVAVGRLPVRTLAELQTIIAKNQQYINQSDNLSAVLVADNSESHDAYNFSVSSNTIADQLIATNWSVDKAYLDEMSVIGARNILLSEMNAGVRLAMYTGHSSSKRWSFENVFNQSDVQSLTNTGNPFGIIQWGCWNTYFVHPEEDSLGHEFMLSGSQGAAFVIGASTLTNAGQESRFSSLFNIYMLSNNLSIGSAMIQAKNEFNAESNNHLHKDILWGVSLLGDPVIKIVD